MKRKSRLAETASMFLGISVGIFMSLGMAEHDTSGFANWGWVLGLGFISLSLVTGVLDNRRHCKNPSGEKIGV